MAEENNVANAGGEESRRIKINFGGTEVEAAVGENGQIIMPEEVQRIMAAGLNVMQRAGQQAAPPNDGEGERPVKSDSSGDAFKGLPMRELIGAPLFAVAEAQEKLASLAWDYYQKIAYEDSGSGSGGESGKKAARILEFELERPVVQDGVVSEETSKVTVKAPFIGLVPIPSLLIDQVDIDFQMEVTETNKTVDTKEDDASTNLSAKLFKVNVGISGKVSSSRENTRTTNQTGKYQVHVSASQQRQTEGLSKLMDVMASCIEPVPSTNS